MATTLIIGVDPRTGVEVGPPVVPMPAGGVDGVCVAAEAVWRSERISRTFSDAALLRAAAEATTERT